MHDDSSAACSCLGDYIKHRGFQCLRVSKLEMRSTGLEKLLQAPPRSTCHRLRSGTTVRQQPTVKTSGATPKYTPHNPNPAATATTKIHSKETATKIHSKEIAKKQRSASSSSHDPHHNVIPVPAVHPRHTHPPSTAVTGH
jgi:hypothetical protein